MHVTLHLTDRCNLACSYCYLRRGQTDLLFETAIQAIKRCAEGPNCGIVFFGGEPLLCKDLIWRVIAWCEENRPNQFHYKVTTNGTLLDPEFMEQASLRRLHVAMSHDGVREAHDRMRTTTGGNGSFDRLLPALRSLLEWRPYSPVMMTVNPETVDLYAESVRWLQGQGVRYLISSLNYAAPWTEADMRHLQSQYRELSDWHYENYRKERKFYFSPFDKRIASRIFGRGSSCRLGRRQISVGPDGRLYPCVQFVGNPAYAIGSAEHGIDEQRREEIYQENEREKPSCVDCPLNGRCHNKCGCLNYQTTRSITTLPAVLCHHERMIFPIADALADRLYRERRPLFLQRHYNPAFPVLSFLEDLALT